MDNFILGLVVMGVAIILQAAISSYLHVRREGKEINASIRRSESYRISELESKLILFSNDLMNVETRHSLRLQEHAKRFGELNSIQSVLMTPYTNKVDRLEKQVSHTNQAIDQCLANVDKWLQVRGDKIGVHTVKFEEIESHLRGVDNTLKGKAYEVETLGERVSQLESVRRIHNMRLDKHKARIDSQYMAITKIHDRERERESK